MIGIYNNPDQISWANFGISESDPYVFLPENKPENNTTSFGVLYNMDILSSNNAIESYTEPFQIVLNKENLRKIVAPAKIRISVGKKDLQNSWNGILPILKKHNVFCAKVAAPETAARMSDTNNNQAGKMVTIYFTHDYENAAALLEKVQNKLIEIGADEGVFPKSDLALGKFIHVSIDRTAEAKYLDADNRIAPKILDLVNTPFYSMNLVKSERIQIT